MLTLDWPLTRNALQSYYSTGSQTHNTAIVSAPNYETHIPRKTVMWLKTKAFHTKYDQYYMNNHPVKTNVSVCMHFKFL